MPVAGLRALAAVVARQHPGDPFADGDIFISPTGSDVNTGTTEAAAVAGWASAISKAGDGGTIVALPGTHPAMDDRTLRTVESVITGRPGAIVPGGYARGAQHLTLRGLRFTGAFQVSWHPVTGAAQPAQYVTLDRCELTAPGLTALTIRDTSSHVTVDRCWVHHMLSGIQGPNTSVTESDHITISRCLIEDSDGDGIQFGDWNDVTISDNTIRRLITQSAFHSDGIQLLGSNQRVVIERNTVHRSTGQLILIQPSVGAIDDVIVRDNLLYDCDAVAIQSQGATNVEIVGNTITSGGGFGALLLRKSGAVIPTDTVVANNILEDYSEIEAVQAAVRSNNLIGTAPSIVNSSGTNEIIGSAGYVDAAAHDYRLLSGSSARGAGSVTYRTATDVLGRTRAATPDIGAFEFS